MIKELEMVATFWAALAILISWSTIMRHLLNYSDPRQQLYIVRILMMIPAYAIQTWLSMVFPKYYLWFNAGRDIYEAYVLYIFMQLLIQYLGGERMLITHLEMKRRVKRPWPCHNYRKIHTDKIFFLRMKQGVFQFVIIKPITAVLSLAADHFGIYDDGSFALNRWFIYLSLINNISVTISLTCLVLFYSTTEDRLKPYRPLSKFVCIKAILFFSFWQSCIFVILTKLDVFGTEYEKSKILANKILNILICIEMLWIALMQSFAFSPQDFITDEIYSKSRCKRFFKKIWFWWNLIRILNVFDVITDAYKTFFTKLPSTEYTFEEIESEIPFDENIEIDLNSPSGIRKHNNDNDSDNEIAPSSRPKAA